MKSYILLAIVFLSTVVGCANKYRLPEEYVSPRAQINYNALDSKQSDNNLALRNLILEAIRTDMIAVGKHPTSAIETSELLTLDRVPPSYSTGTSRASYNARVRLHYSHHWFDEKYLVYERNGELAVRKTSF